MRRYRGGLAGRGVHAVRNVQKVSYLLRHRCFRSECVIILDSKIASEYVGLWIQSHFWQVEKKGLQDVITKGAGKCRPPPPVRDSPPRPCAHPIASRPKSRTIASSPAQTTEGLLEAVITRL